MWNILVLLVLLTNFDRNEARICSLFIKERNGLSFVNYCQRDSQVVLRSNGAQKDLFVFMSRNEEPEADRRQLDSLDYDDIDLPPPMLLTTPLTTPLVYEPAPLYYHMPLPMSNFEYEVSEEKKIKSEQYSSSDLEDLAPARPLRARKPVSNSGTSLLGPGSLGPSLGSSSLGPGSLGPGSLGPSLGPSYLGQTFSLGADMFSSLGPRGRARGRLRFLAAEEPSNVVRLRAGDRVIYRDGVTPEQVYLVVDSFGRLKLKKICCKKRRKKQMKNLMKRLKKVYWAAHFNPNFNPAIDLDFALPSSQKSRVKVRRSDEDFDDVDDLDDGDESDEEAENVGKEASKSSKNSKKRSKS